MASLGMGLLSSGAAGAATGAATNGLASGAINGLTDIGKMLGAAKGGGIPAAGGAQQGQPQYGNNNSDALTSYVMQLLNNGKGPGQ